MSEQLIELALFLGQDLTSVERMTASRIQFVFASETFKAWKQSRDQSLKLPGIVVGRLDNIAKQLHSVAKQLATPR